MKNVYLLLIILSSFFCIKTYAQCSTPASLPYYEGFQSITNNGQLPPCWSVSNPTSCTTNTTNNGGRATFTNSPAGTSSFYSGGIQLNAGVIYSVSLWYACSNFGNNFYPWSGLSIEIGPNQSSLGAQMVASVSGPTAVMGTALSNTFTVSNSGIYFASVNAVSTSTAGPSYINWDDFSITIPCTYAYNTPTVSVASSATFICSGQPAGQLVMIANGADTYSWSTGATTQTITDSPNNSNVYTVIGTNTLSGCASSASILISVNPSPNVLVHVNKPGVCKGSSLNLTAYGANTYTWSTGQQISSISVSPSFNTTYTVSGANNFGCVTSVSQFIQVYGLPSLTISSAVPSNTICSGDLDTLTVSGASSFTWAFGSTLLQGNQIIVTPSITTNYVVTGIDNNNCSSQSTFVLNVNGCTGLTQLNLAQRVIYISPNPFQNELFISTGSRESKTLEITDLSGRRILFLLTEEEPIIVNTKYYTYGLYYLRINSGGSTSVHKIIKN